MYIFIYKYVPTNNYSFIDIDDAHAQEKKKVENLCRANNIMCFSGDFLYVSSTASLWSRAWTFLWDLLHLPPHLGKKKN